MRPAPRHAADGDGNQSDCAQLQPHRRKPPESKGSSTGRNVSTRNVVIVNLSLESRFTCPTLPERRIALRLRFTESIENPCCCNQLVTWSISACAIPKRAANSSGVSHLWNDGDVGSCWAASSASRPASWLAERQKAMVMPFKRVPAGTLPASNSGLAAG